jgi:hypothetical protein
MSVATVTMILFLWAMQGMHGDIRISEFSAFNESGLSDEDGSHVDWVELINLGSKTVNLKDWSLTDDAQSLRKWTFPFVSIAPGSYLVVFASGKDRRDPDAPLHTNFKLSAEGEFLALVNLDQEIVANAFSPTYPQQFRDTSYGFGLEQSSLVLVPTDASGKIHIPSDGNQGLNWTTPEFQDGVWQTVENGVGYETGEEDPSEGSYAERIIATEPALYWRLNESTGLLADNLGTVANSGQGRYQGNLVLGEAGPRSPEFTDFETNNQAPLFDGINSFIEGPSRLLNDRAAFTMAGWVLPTSDQSNRTGLWGQNDAIEFGFINNSTLQLWTPAGSVNVAYGSTVNEWHHIVAVGTGTILQIYKDGQLAAESSSNGGNYGSSTFTFNAGGGGIFDASGNLFEGLMDEISVWTRALSAQDIAGLLKGKVAVDFDPHIKTDITKLMHGVNSSAYIRYPFELEDPSTINRLLLRVRYDDGFVAWLNGFEATSIHAPEEIKWNASATQRHPDSQAIQWQELDITTSLNALSLGRNILAIQGLNIDSNNSDFLMHVELVAIRHGATSASPRFFTEPSPGEPNGIGREDMGPLLRNVNHSPNRPNDNEPLKITAQVESTFSELTSVTLHYRVQFGSEISIDMLDLGDNGDAQSNDNIWTAMIPAQAATSGELIRYYITAINGNGNQSRWPFYPDPIDSEAYNGTTVLDSSIQTTLPVVQLFVENVSAADSGSGTRAAVYYDGELYDNVHMSVHGQSSRGFPKKSYNLDFTSDHRFKYKSDQRRVKDIRLMTNWGDKSRIRNALAYEMIEQSGSIGHFSFQVRVQRNSEFFSIADFMEDGDDRWLERIGRDPNGALYKMYNNLGGAGGNEKKTRRWENTSDLQALVSTLNPNRSLDQRIQDAWDMIDLPQTISYCVALALCSSQDHGHKNYYVYRDSDGSGEWALLPWDVDLSWGRNWLDSRGYFTDTLFQNNELDFYNASQQGKPSNRFYNLIFEAPQFREMVLRRLRTVMDTVLQAPGTAKEELIIEKRIREMLRAMDPAGIAPSDADLDYQRWGSWGNRNEMREEAERIMSTHLPGRRTFLFQENPRIGRDAIPSSQLSDATVQFGAIEFNPSSGNQDEEYVELINSNAHAIDLTNWKLEGAVRHTFRPGTVIPKNQSLYVSPNVAAFRSRNQGPMSGQGLFVQGNYSGQLNARGETIQLTSSNQEVKAIRTFEGNPSQAQLQLRVTEIYYHPDSVTGLDHAAADYEFIELQNIGTTPLSLQGISLSKGIQFEFSNNQETILQPDAFLVIVRNQSAFEARYGNSSNIAGEFTGALNNQGETLVLEDANGEKILEFDYDNSWHPITEGLGFSLRIKDAMAPWNHWNEPTSWQPSTQPGGSPGRAAPEPPTLMGVVINEILAHTDLPQLDSVELWNPTNQDIRLDGWFLTDDFFNSQKYQIPDNTLLLAGNFAVISETELNANPQDPTSFAFGSHGDEVYLFPANPSGKLQGTYHGFEFGASPNGVSFGRHITSDMKEHFVLMEQPSLGAPNPAPLVGTVVISEIMYHPRNFQQTAIIESHEEYIELENISPVSQTLNDISFTNHTWRLRGAITYDFPENLTMASNTRLLIVGFDPSDQSLLSNFRSKYQLPDSIQIIGPWEGQLNNAGEKIQLLQPDTPDPDFVPYVVIDQVDYNDTAPWPTEADGFGNSLQRQQTKSFGNNPENWFAAPPTPGALNVVNIRPTVTWIEPSTGASFDRPVDIILTATATDPDGQIESVAFYNRGQQLGVDTTVPFDWLWSNAPAGEHILTARAQDDRLGLSESESVTIVVRSQPPAITWSLPANEAVVGTGVETPILVETEDSDGGVVQVTYFANDQEIGQAFQAPFLISWSPPLAGNYTLMAEAVDDTGTRNRSNPRILHAVKAILQDNVLIRPGAEWKYLDNGIDPGATWSAPEYVDGSWNLGTAELGYGDGDEATVISFGPNSSSKHPTSWFRHTFHLNETSNIVSSELRIVRDDGVLARINGIEVFRDNLPDGEITSSTWALGVISNDDESRWLTTSIPADILKQGANVIAVEMHQANGSSSDISFNAKLTMTETSLAPFIRSEPQDLIIQAGQTPTLITTVEGSSPLSYQWFFNGIAIEGETKPSLTLNQILPSQTGEYHLLASNVIGTALSRMAQITVENSILDSDGDGLPDHWELAYGMNPLNNIGNQGTEGDFDLDGASNFDEYQAGTIPNDPTSVFRLAIKRESPDSAFIEITVEAKADKSYSLESMTLGSEQSWKVISEFTSEPNNRIIKWSLKAPSHLGQLFRFTIGR